MYEDMNTDLPRAEEGLLESGSPRKNPPAVWIGWSICFSCLPPSTTEADFVILTWKQARGLFVVGGQGWCLSGTEALSQCFEQLGCGALRGAVLQVKDWKVHVRLVRSQPYVSTKLTGERISVTYILQRSSLSVLCDQDPHSGL